MTKYNDLTIPNMVIVRMGEAGDGANFAVSTFDDDVWGKINALIN